MNHKTVTSKDRIMLNEAKTVVPPGNGVFLKQVSAQKRLCPKAETRKPASNNPIWSHGSSPAVSGMRQLGHCSIKTDAPMEEDHFNTVSMSSSLPQVAPKSFWKPRSPLTPPFSPDGVLKAKKDLWDSCICTRPKKLILCSACGHTTAGRLRKTCQVHPKTLHLLDMDACPSCKETQAVLQEYELPEGSDQRSHVKDRKEEYKEKVITKKGKRAGSEDDVGLQYKRMRRDAPRFSRR